ncbi:hypothetical protein PYEL_19350 [Pseudomonas sp. URMO17WK12:I11]|nr:hypothetical protein PYEL_19350 [Pseudomonas sp. URMO17WK12:I11]
MSELPELLMTEHPAIPTQLKLCVGTTKLKLLARLLSK